MMLNNYKKDDYLKKISFLSMLILIIIFFVSFISILIHISNRFGFTEIIKNDSIKSLFYMSSPVRIRWYTILGNANIYAHLVTMTFFLSFIPYIYYKSSRCKIIILLMQITNIITLIFTGSKGAIIALLFGLIFATLFYITRIRSNRKKLILLFSGFFIIVVLPIISIFIFRENAVVKYFLSSILRINRTSERFEIWLSLVKLPLFLKPFGYSDNYIYNYMSNLNITEYKVFLSNQGRAHNIYIQALVSFGSIGFVLFMVVIGKTLYNIIFIKNNINVLFIKYYHIFVIQFIVILISGIFEQLPLFNLSPHSLIFMLVWANLITFFGQKDID